MKLNEREICLFAFGPGDKEGRIYHKTYTNTASFNPGFVVIPGIGFKERWFKLKGNLLFYYKVNEFGGINSKDPIAFEPEPEKKHIFGCSNQQICEDWISVLKRSSYQRLKNELQELQMKIIAKTGSDPLSGTVFFNQQQ
ncbi:pleckstriny domain-containing family J member 1-like protein [Dinothrombium tinctorium]|uniref:Pleckstriny domain-containing family J member 1-like protein n=1 Tax=Dinothrombium tinctorium TaxID=1965070 RepID=A0A443RLW2_9ACAR|nr:pleckstriny domain-containing family J member 1-like protein [Dinothrombium tinctorium]